MKKFLSLVLALVMAMSLVTISAGATEYKDLTDKDEIKYEEAVAVLNRIGVITGYEDGSFKPETELTRGAAAKIIVSLLIGPEAASNLPNNYAPYPDVPAGHTFAGVISYCKTKGIISGYGDGTFKPANTLTGYAFAKMLLGAVGYDTVAERFVDTGWTMNVASVGQSAGLFDRLKFDGSAAVTRQEACQLALNALKATVVEYSQGINVNVTGENTNVVVNGGQVRSYKTSNQEFARNIRTRNYTEVSSSDNYYTVEFAEEHFVDLRLEHDKWNPTSDDFGRPSAEWSYKKVTIGTYPLDADFTFTTQVAHDDVSNATKERALGMKGYELHPDGVKTNTTALWVNGNKIEGAFEEVADIANYTDNGTLVEVYVSENDADYITDVVVIHTQLMEVKRVGSDYVSLDTIGQDNKRNSDTGATKLEGFNQAALSVEVQNVRDTEDNVYAVLSALKAGDEVAIVPVTADNGRTYTVSKAYVPETVTGKLTKATTYAAVSKTPAAIDITVGDTTYKIADWNKGMYDLDADKIKITRKDVTLVLDEYGNALRAKDVGETDDYMVIGSFSQTLANGKIVWNAEGWDGKGNALTLNVGTSKPAGVQPGDLVHYTSNNVSSNAEWRLETGHAGRVYDVDLDTATANQYMKSLADAPNHLASEVYTGATFDGNGDATAGFTTAYQIKASNVRVALAGVDDDANTDGQRDDGSRYLVRDPKFIYVQQEDNNGVKGTDVDTIEFFTGAQKVTTQELYQMFTNGSNHRAQAYVNKDGYIECVVIKTQSNNALSTNLLYVKNYIGTHEYKEVNGVKYYGYIVAMMTNDGLEDPVEIYSTRKLNRGDFATYSKTTDENAPNPDSFYTLKEYTSQRKTTSVALVSGATVLTNIIFGGNDKDSKDLLKLGTVYEMDGKTVATTNISKDTQVLDELGDTSESNVVRVLKNAEWVDVTRQQYGIDSIDELEDYTGLKLALVFNDSESSDGFRTVSMIVVIEATSTKNNAKEPTATVTGAANSGAVANTVSKNTVVTLTAPDYTSNSDYGEVTYQWQKSTNTTNGKDGDWSDIPGATSNSFTVPTDKADAGTSYRVVIKNYDASKTESKRNEDTSVGVKFIVTATEEGQATVSVDKGSLSNVQIEGAPTDKDGNAIIELGKPLTMTANAAANRVAKVTVTYKNADNEEVTKDFWADENGKIEIDAIPEGATDISIAVEEVAETEKPLPTNQARLTVNVESGLDVMNGTENVFDGDSIVVTKNGTLALNVSQFPTVAGKLLAVVAGAGTAVEAPAEGAFGTVRIKVTGDAGEVTFKTIDDVNLAAAAAKFTRADLYDHTEGSNLNSGALNDGYTFNASANGDGIDLTFTHTGEYSHKINAGQNSSKTWVVGFNANTSDAGEGAWTLSSVSVDDKAISSGNAVNFGKNDGAYWLTFYQANHAKVAEMQSATAMGNDGVTTGTAVFTNGTVTRTITLNVDCSRVTLKPYNDTYTPAA